MHSLKPAILCIFCSLLLSTNVFSKTFSNQYTQFELPPGWECSIEGSEWVCQSENKDRKKEAIIILAAKIRGQNDSLQAYQAYLKKGKTFQLPGGKFQKSEPKYTKLKVINKHQWADALHLASEVPGFYTRYLATVKEDLGVAVTFSVTKDMYNVYQGIFDNVVATLRVFRQKKNNLAVTKLKNRNKDANFDDAVFVDEGDTFNIAQGKSKKGKSSSGEDDFTLLLLIAAAVGGFIYMKKKKKK
ncbi:MAG: hypothetical protein N4A33_00555 [Bacteriovoracaceae bacterium]|jgi:hypothetical protein|nr:hypothetical protein [Bacteriovoracaceae bacterium]